MAVEDIIQKRVAKAAEIAEAQLDAARVIVAKYVAESDDQDEEHEITLTAAVLNAIAINFQTRTMK